MLICLPVSLKIVKNSLFLHFIRQQFDSLVAIDFEGKKGPTLLNTLLKNCESINLPVYENLMDGQTYKQIIKLKPSYIKISNYNNSASNYGNNIRYCPIRLVRSCSDFACAYVLQPLFSKALWTRRLVVIFLKIALNFQFLKWRWSKSYLLNANQDPRQILRLPWKE